MDTEKINYWKEFSYSVICAIYRIVEFFIRKKNDKDKNKKNSESE